MPIKRLYPFPAWPPDGYPDWPPVRSVLRSEFKERYDGLETDLFRDAFSLAGRGTEPDPVRTDKTKAMALALILDQNLPLVFFMTRRVGLVTEADLRDVVSDAVTGVLSEVGRRRVHDLLCDWHDAVRASESKDRGRLRRRVVRRLVQSAARKLQRARGLYVGLDSLASFAEWQESADRDTILEAVAVVLKELKDRTLRRIFNLHYVKGLTFHAVLDELTARGAKLSLTGIYRRATKIRDKVRAAYEALQDGAR